MLTFCTDDILSTKQHLLLVQPPPPLLCAEIIYGGSLEGPPAALLVAFARVQAVLGARARTVAAQRPPAVPSYVAVGRGGRNLAMDKNQ